MRTRDRGILTAQTIDLSWRNLTSGTTGSTTTGSLAQGGSRRVITDDLTPDYFQKKKSGLLLPINYCSNSRVTTELTGGIAEETDYSNGVPYFRTTASGPFSFISNSHSPSVPSLPSYDLDQLIVEARSRARSAAWDMSTFLAEYHKTKDLIAGATKRWNKEVDRLFEAAKRGKGKRQAVEFLTSAWLEGRYGWRVLAYDAKNIAEALARLNESFLTQRAYVKSSDNVSAFKASPGVYGLRPQTDWLHCIYDFESTVQVTRTVTVGALATLRADAFRAAQINPFVTGYELIPLSFVADWFCNLGEWISAYSPDFRIASTEMWQSVDTTTTRVHTCTGGRGNPGFPDKQLTRFEPSVTRRDENLYVRSRITTTPLPGFRLNLSPGKIVDGIALAISNKARLLRLLSSRA